MSVVNMLEAKTNLSKLVQAVESGAEAEIVIARKGKPAARIVPLSEPDVGKRLGLLAGKFPVLSLEDFNSTDDEIAEMFGVKP
jgi:prevent-host-death family protein